MFTIKNKFLAAMAFQPRNGAADGYMFDLDGSIRNVRLKTGIDKFPVPTNNGSFAQLGSMNPLVPLMNAFVYAQAYGKIASGPIASVLPENLQWQITIPGLNKYMPQS
jgi:hypothetical protein